MFKFNGFIVVVLKNKVMVYEEKITLNFDSLDSALTYLT